jgi:penicillin-binding protein 2
MIHRFFKKFRRFGQKPQHEIAPEDIFLDSSNLPEFDKNQFEGKLERPISRTVLVSVFAIAVLVLITFAGRLWALQISNGEDYRTHSENNRLDYSILFADRGIIYDRNSVPLAWNTVDVTGEKEFSLRSYTSLPGVSHVLGFVKYPTKDKAGFYFREDYEGKAGVELIFNDILRGKNGRKLVETDVHGELHSQGVVERPVHGNSLTLTIDSRIQAKLYELMQNLAGEVGFNGGAGLIMDLTNGEVLAHVTFPEFNSQIMTDGTDREAISRFSTDQRNVFLNRVNDGMYAPGSTVKPIVALAALNEGTIDPAKQILSTGAISIPNPYFPDKPTVFKDWKAHGWVDMRRALAVSSDVYFYAVGGGFEDQRGLGIAKLDSYFTKFGFGQPITAPFFETKAGVIPTPAWKEKTFGEKWLLGNTYHSSIGQYGFQVTPLHLLKATALIALKGTAPEPTIVKRSEGESVPRISVDGINPTHYNVIHEGMRLGVTEGTVRSLDFGFVQVAAKTGTAEIGVTKDYVHSWATGFFPYRNPKYAFVVLMERGPKTNLIGAPFVMNNLMRWMHEEKIIDFSS